MVVYLGFHGERRISAAFRTPSYVAALTAITCMTLGNSSDPYVGTPRTAIVLLP